MSDTQPADRAPSGTDDQSAAASALPRDLLDILVCPLGKKPLRLENDALICTHCGARFKIEDGIPNMLLDDATLPEGVAKIEELACFDDSATTSGTADG